MLLYLFTVEPIETPTQPCRDCSQFSNHTSCWPPRSWFWPRTIKSPLATHPSLPASVFAAPTITHQHRHQKRINASVKVQNTQSGVRSFVICWCLLVLITWLVHLLCRSPFCLFCDISNFYAPLPHTSTQFHSNPLYYPHSSNLIHLICLGSTFITAFFVVLVSSTNNITYDFDSYQDVKLIHYECYPDNKFWRWAPMTPV